MKADANIKDRHIHYAANLILSYKGDEPFHQFLKKYFRLNKKHGSNDRRHITGLCYGYFRLGNGIIVPMSVEDKIRLGKELSSADRLVKTLLQRAEVFDPQRIFPLAEELSPKINEEGFSYSFLIQPDLFLRIRPGHSDAVSAKLRGAGIPFEAVSDTALRVDNNTAIEKQLDINKEVVIQDLSSQRTAEFFGQTGFDPSERVKIWDACAASGGKTILAFDYFPKALITVSDKRKSILKNLEKRLKEAGVAKYRSLKLDLSVPETKLRDASFDLIIADLPCSGSGTWGRTPEQLHFFDSSQIDRYVALQQNIIAHSIPKLRPGGYLLFITCSVFRRENEDNVKHINKTHALTLIDKQYLSGYESRADTLFAALFQKAG